MKPDVRGVIRSKEGPMETGRTIEARERALVMVYPSFLRRRFKKQPTGGELAKAEHAFARELDERYGFTFAVTFYPFFGRQWTRTGWLLADPDWGRVTDLPIGDAVSGAAIAAAYSRVRSTRLLPHVGTAQLWTESELALSSFLAGLRWLWENGQARGVPGRHRAYQHVNRQGRAVYVVIETQDLPISVPLTTQESHAEAHRENDGVCPWNPGLCV